MPTTRQPKRNATKSVSSAALPTLPTAPTAPTTGSTSSPISTPVPVPISKPDSTPAPASTPENSSVHDASSKSKKSVKKAGRTILVRTVSGTELSSSVFDGLEGLQSRTETKSAASWFLTFDTADHALAAFKKLRSDSTDYRVKFSYYRIFFTITGLTDTSDYTQVKTELMNYVNEKSGATPLYCKFYRRDTKYIGCGDFTVDTLESMNKLIAKEGGLRDFSFGSYSGSFFRYNSRKEKAPVS